MYSNPSVNQADEPTPNDELQLSSRERATSTINRFLANTRPSSRQLSDLKSLGFRGEDPCSMLQASEVIAELTLQKGGRK